MSEEPKKELRLSEEAEKKLFRVSRRSRPYTKHMAPFFSMFLMWYTIFDSAGPGFKFVSRAFGVQSVGWTWAWFVAAALIGFNISFRIIFINHVTHAVKSQTEETVDFDEAGGGDLTLWTIIVTLSSTIYLFGTVIPAGTLATLRPVAALLVLVIVTAILSKTSSNIVFSALYGPFKRHEE